MSVGGEDMVGCAWMKTAGRMSPSDKGLEALDGSARVRLWRIGVLPGKKLPLLSCFWGRRLRANPARSACLPVEEGFACFCLLGIHSFIHLLKTGAQPVSVLSSLTHSFIQDQWELSLLFSSCHSFTYSFKTD